MFPKKFRRRQYNIVIREILIQEKKASTKHSYYVILMISKRVSNRVRGHIIIGWEIHFTMYMKDRGL